MEQKMKTEIIVEQTITVKGIDIYPTWQYATQVVTTDKGMFVNTPVKSKYRFEAGDRMWVKVSDKRYGRYKTITPV